MRGFAPAVLMVALIARGASATPLSITETTDFSNTAPGSVIGTLDIGVNTIAGSVNFATGDLADYFQLTLPALMKITVWELDITNLNDTFVLVCPSGSCSGTPTPHLGSYTSDGPPAPFLALPMTIASNGVPVSSLSVTPGGILSGPATFDVGFVAPFLTNQDGWQLTSGGGYDYSVEYTVESTGSLTAVPEPATLTLTGLGLAGVVRRVRRRRAAR